jgi:hypothetical protein
MTVPEKALAAEREGWKTDGSATLADAFRILSAEWRKGNRSKDVGLHLLFLAWYALMEPPHLTGFAEPNITSRADALQPTMTEVFNALEPELSNDPEFLYAVGLMIQLAPWFFGDVHEWEERSAEFRKRYRKILPAGISPEVFVGRGAYGEYFASQARVKGGF